MRFIKILLMLTVLEQYTLAWQPETHEPVAFIVDQFEDYPIVALGEVHGLEDAHALYSALVKSQAFRSKVKNIVLEYGNALYQDLIDDYTSGKNVSLEELRKVWRNLFVAPMLQYGSDQFEHLFKTVRQLNQGLAPEKQLRILAGGPPIDWGQIKSVKDYTDFQNKNSRDVHYGQVVINEVLKKNERALLISGSLHLKKQSTLITLINQSYPGSVYHIYPLTDFADRTAELTQRVPGWKKPGIVPLKGTWLSDIDKPSVTSNVNVLLKGLTDADEQRDGDIIVKKGPDGKKKVIQISNGNMILIESEGGNNVKAGNQQIGAAPQKQGNQESNAEAKPAGATPAYINLPVGRWRRTVEDEGRTLLDIADAILWVSDKSQEVNPAIWDDDAFWNTLDQRLLMLTGQKLDPRIRSTKGKFDAH